MVKRCWCCCCWSGADDEEQVQKPAIDSMMTAIVAWKKEGRKVSEKEEGNWLKKRPKEKATRSRRDIRIDF